MRIAELATHFVRGGHVGRIHNAVLEVQQETGQDFQTCLYKLHGRAIAERWQDGFGRINVLGMWGGRYTSTAERHLKAIIEACRQEGLVATERRPSARAARQQAGIQGHASPFIIV